MSTLNGKHPIIYDWSQTCVTHDCNCKKVILKVISQPNWCMEFLLVDHVHPEWFMYHFEPIFTNLVKFMGYL